MKVVEVALLVLLSFLALFSLSLVITLNAMSIYLVIAVALYTFIGPLLSLVDDARIYFAVLPIPYIGSWLISLVSFSSLGISHLHTAYLSSAIPALTVTLMHLSSRMKNFMSSRPLSALAGAFFTENTFLLLIIGLLLLGIEPIKLDPHNKIMVYGVLSCLYCASSLTFVNPAYRFRRLCKTLGTNSVSEVVEPLLKRIEEKFPDGKEDVKLLRHYYFEAVRLFMQGSYEMAFFSAYKIIREKTVVDPTKYISDKRDGDPSSFSIIRAMLLHSRVKDARINPREIMRIKAKLPEFTLEAIQRATMLIEKLAA